MTEDIHDLFLIVLLAFVSAAGYLLLRSKSMHIWMFSHIGYVIKNALASKPRGLTHIMFCFVDHYEPKWENPAREIEKERVDTWLKKYPELADRWRDSDGKSPQHTWFYPAEEYEQDHLEKLSALCRRGYGEIELHLHHHDDTSEGVRAKIHEAIRQFGNHGALHTVDESSGPRYAFIHGNWHRTIPTARAFSAASTMNTHHFERDRMLRGFHSAVRAKFVPDEKDQFDLLRDRRPLETQVP